MPQKLRILIASLTAIAAIILFLSGVYLDYPENIEGWIVLIFLGLSTIPISVSMRSAEVEVCLWDTYVMAIAMVYGISACVIATAVLGLAHFLVAGGYRKPFLAAAFSFSAMVCDAFLYSMTFHFTASADAAGIKDLLFPAAVMALVSFLFNSLLTGTVVSWRLGKRISWARVYLPLSLNSIIAAGCAVIIATWLGVYLWVPFLAAPVTAIIWYWTKAHSARLERAAIPSKA